MGARTRVPVMGKKRWHPPSGPSTTDKMKMRKQCAMSWEERRELVESSKKERGSSSLAQWEADNVDGDIDEQVQKNLELRVAQKALEKAKKKAKKEEAKKAKKE